MPRLTKEQEAKRLEELCIYEKKFADEGYIGGIDEVGRGSFAGPVMAACVILPQDARIEGINDSKKLSPKKRDLLYDVIKEQAIAIGIGLTEASVIDEIGILEATYAAMQQAIDQMEIKPDRLLIDAVKIPSITIPQTPIIHGDAKSQSIAAASIIAKVTRDRMMVQYDELIPGYELASNKGYGTKAHIDALKELGPSILHRRSFIHRHWSEEE